MRLPAALVAVPLLAALLVVGGCSPDESVDQVNEEVAPSPTTSSTPATPKPSGPWVGDGAAQPPADDEQAAPRSGPVFSSANVRCVEEYSPEAMTGRAFAFDGTVTEIGGAVSNRGDSGDLPLSGVTFRVEEWFVGEGPATFTVDMLAPTKSEASESAPSYHVGSRLLVSGEDRWGEASEDGSLEDPIAWGCGFTRYFDEETAAAWRSAS